MSARSDETRIELGDRRAVVVCDCGVIARNWAAARCGRDLRRNVRMDCPAVWGVVELVKVDEVEHA